MLSGAARCSVWHHRGEHASSHLDAFNILAGGCSSSDGCGVAVFMAVATGLIFG